MVQCSESYIEICVNVCNVVVMLFRCFVCLIITPPPPAVSKDLKAAADTSMMQEFEKVVKFNVRQVIEFELRITGKPSIG